MIRKIPALALALTGLTLLTACGGTPTRSYETPAGGQYPLFSTEGGNTCNVQNPEQLAPGTPCFP